ncbi:MAG: STAS domain-containing protein [Planctomycetota bacterium]|nr:STAS domain-containing protein [Planctomycetota bacterium]
MAALSAETIDKILWISGTVGPSSQNELSAVLDSYMKGLGDGVPTLDLSNVKYFPSSAAKALLISAQDIQSKGRKLKVRSSLAVAQTLNMLGAQSWVEIEACAKPNPIPAAPEAEEPVVVPVRPPEVRGDGKGSQVRLKAVTASEAESSVSMRKGDSGTQLTPGQKKERFIHDGKTDSYQPKIHITRPDESNLRGTPAIKPGSSGSKLPAIPPAETSAAAVALRQAKAKEDDEVMELANERAATPLARPDEDLPENLMVLHKLLILQTYTFNFGDFSLTGKVLTRVGGPWILIDQHGSRRWLNLNHLRSIDVL